MIRFLSLLYAILLCTTFVDSYSLKKGPSSSEQLSRRSAFQLVPRAFVVATVTASAVVLSSPPTKSANALDIDSFIQKELDSETCDEKVDKKCIRKLSEDEALCRFGQPSKETGEACRRAGISSSRSGSGRGGVDAYGSVDRGEFVRCKAQWVDNGSPKLVKTWTCQNTPLQ